MFNLYKKYLDGKPIYLVRHYWWAYLSPRFVRFFDHPFIINAILFGHYRKLMNATLSRLAQAPLESVLQLTCVYGSLTPNLLRHLKPGVLHITDVAQIQLDLAKTKTVSGAKLLATRMNAEALGYKANSFSTIVLFFLLHEMPHSARRNTLSEAMRTLRPGGSLIVTEYGVLPTQHWLYRFWGTRRVLTGLEPFLEGFWHEDIEGLLQAVAAPYDKRVELVSHDTFFASFYRVTEFRVVKASSR